MCASMCLASSQPLPWAPVWSAQASLARHLNRMKLTFPAEYAFFPMTWLLPMDAHKVGGTVWPGPGCLHVLVRPWGGPGGAEGRVLTQLRIRFGPLGAPH
jgi:hypothetical protein